MGILSTFNSLTNDDRHNLADIAWYIKGMIHAKDETFCEDHLNSLEHVISAIRNKINDEKNEQRGTGS